MDSDKFNEIKRLNFEDFIWIVFIILSILDIVADNYQKKYIITDIEEFENMANKLYTLIVFVSLFIYLYFFYRNYKAYNKVDINDENKRLFEIKLFGSVFFLVGVLCLLYFQININSNNDNNIFIGGPIFKY